MNIKTLEKMSTAIYIAVEDSIANDISDGIKWAINRIKELETCMMCSNGKNYICDKCLVVWEKAEARQVEMLDECRKRVITLEGK